MSKNFIFRKEHGCYGARIGLSDLAEPKVYNTLKWLSKWGNFDKVWYKDDDPDFTQTWYLFEFGPEQYKEALKYLITNNYLPLHE